MSLLKKALLHLEIVQYYLLMSNFTYILKLIKWIVATRQQKHMANHKQLVLLQSVYNTFYSTETAFLKVQNNNYIRSNRYWQVASPHVTWYVSCSWHCGWWSTVKEWLYGKVMLSFFWYFKLLYFLLQGCPTTQQTLFIEHFSQSSLCGYCHFLEKWKFTHFYE